jgi:hypothetical protein
MRGIRNPRMPNSDGSGERLTVNSLRRMKGSSAVVCRIVSIAP